MSSFALSPNATSHILTRRLLAWVLDVLIVAIVVLTLHVALAILGIVTLGLGWLLLGAVPFVPFLYSFMTLAGRHAATPGQRVLGLTVTHIDGRRPTPLEALVSTVLFYVSLGFPPVLLIALITPRHRTLHDLFSGLVVIRAETSADPDTRWAARGRQAA